MFGATSKVKNNDKEKWVYSGYGLTFDGASSWNFGNSFARNAVIFGVNNSSLSRADNHEKNFSVLMEALVHQRKKLVLTSVKQRQHCA